MNSSIEKDLIPPLQKLVKMLINYNLSKQLLTKLGSCGIIITE